MNAAKPRGKNGKAQPKVQVQGSSRRAALSVLDAVLGRQIPLDLAFERAVSQQKLSGPDRGFARALAAIVLRRLGQIDDAVDPFLRRPLPKRALTPRNILRLGAAQILFLETPAHAAVSETTDLASGKNKTYRGLTNAVLRRIAEAGPELLEGQSAARQNTPEWLWQSWRKSYGSETALAIAEAHQLEPPLDISLLKGDPADWPEKLEATLLPTGSLRRTISAAVPDLAGFTDGVWQVQDAAAALPARMLGDVSGKRVIDLCAAPGGKTSQLVSAGANVVAVDAGAERMPRVQENLKRLGLEAETVIADATEWRPETPVDAILLDAPCSSTGTIRRRPRRALVEAATGRDEPGRNPGRTAPRRGRYAEARRNAGLCLLLTGGRGRAGPDRDVPGRLPRIRPRAASLQRDCWLARRCHHRRWCPPHLAQHVAGAWRHGRLFCRPPDQADSIAAIAAIAFAASGNSLNTAAPAASACSA